MSDSLSPLDNRTIRRLMERVRASEKRIDGMARATPSRHTSIDSGPGLTVVGEDGQPVYQIGRDSSGVVAPVYAPGPVPAQPSAPVVDPGAGMATIVTDGLDADGNPAPADHRRTVIHASLTSGFEPTAGTAAGSMMDAAGVTTIALPAGMWHIRIVWVTLSGRTSAPSAQVDVDVEPLVDVEDIEATLQTARDELAAATAEAEAWQADYAQRTEDAEQAIQDATGRLATAEATLAPLPEDVAEAKRVARDAEDAAIASAAAAAEANARALSMIPNGSFEQGMDYWDVIQGDPQVVTEPTYSGGHALSGSGLLDIKQSKSLPISSGQIWEVSAWSMYQPDGTPGSAFTLLTFIVTDSSGAAVVAHPVFNFDLAVDEWVQTSARFTAPEDSAFLMLGASSNTDAGTIFHDDITLRDVTDVVRLEAAAQEAKAAGEKAQSDAAALPKVLHGTTAPSGTAPEGSIWWQHQGSLSGRVIGQWNRTEGAWVSTPIDSEAIANLDVGKLTAGSAEVADAVLHRLVAGKAAIIAAEIQNLTVTQKANFADAFAEQFWAEMAVIDRLQATAGWIGGALIKDNAITVDNINVTEALTAALLQARKVRGDEIDGNTFTGNTFNGGTFTGALIRGGVIQQNGTTPEGDAVTSELRTGADGPGIYFNNTYGPIGSLVAAGILDGIKLEAAKFQSDVLGSSMLASTEGTWIAGPGHSEQELNYVFAGRDYVQLRSAANSTWEPGDSLSDGTSIYANPKGILAEASDGDRRTALNIAPSGATLNQRPIATTSAWRNLTKVNGWINVTGRPAARYRIEGDTLRLSGAVQSGTNGLIGTLPTGFRPASYADVPATKPNSQDQTRITVESTGRIVSNQLTSASGTYISLDGITIPLS